MSAARSNTVTLASHDAADPVPYERRLANNLRWALDEASEYFDAKGSVHAALRKVVARLDEIGVPYAIVGGLALFNHGFRRFTEDVDILVTADGLRRIHEALDGLGYVPPFKGSRQLRDAEFGVRIEFLVTGQYPGDGKPKPVAFPPPDADFVTVDGIRYIGLSRLVELKLASGMTNAARLKDLADVVEVLRLLKLPRDYGDALNPFVRTKFFELWDAVASSPPDDEGPEHLAAPLPTK